MSAEFHWPPFVIDERVRATQLLDGNHPRKALGSWSLLFTKGGENCGGCLGPTAWCKRSEVPHRMTMALWEVLRPQVDELLDCAPLRLPSVCLLVLAPEPHRPVGDIKGCVAEARGSVSRTRRTSHTLKLEGIVPEVIPSHEIGISDPEGDAECALEVEVAETLPIGDG